MRNQKILKALCINRIPRLNSKNKRILLEKCSSSDNLLNLRAHTLRRVFAWRGEELDMQELLDDARRDLDKCLKSNMDVLVLGDEDYPELLSHIYDPPFMLFCRGRKLEKDFSGVALVGTRKPTGEALTQAFQMGLDLALRECPVVSGLALGIDGAAHRGALAGWGWTVGVLACGVDCIYPAEHRRLAWEMLETGGTIISEYTPGSSPRKYRYPQRNRLISGLSTVSVVVQAPARSGALITADFALQEGRDLLVGSAGLHSDGSSALAEQGAPVISRGRELVQLLGIETEEMPGIKLNSPRQHREVIHRLEGELLGKIINYGGTQYRGF